MSNLVTIEINKFHLIFVFDQFVIGVFVHERVEILPAANRNFVDPVLLGVFVDQPEVVLDLLVVSLCK